MCFVKGSCNVVVSDDGEVGQVDIYILRDDVGVSMYLYLASTSILLFRMLS